VFEKKAGKGPIYFNDIKIKMDFENTTSFGNPMTIDIEIFAEIEIQNLECSFQIFDNSDKPIVYNWVTTSLELIELVGKKGRFNISISIPSLRLYKGEYYLGFYLSDPRGKVVYDNLAEFYPFEVNMGGILNEWGWADNACKYIENVDVSTEALQ
jgi:hypothetical protein